MAFKDSLFLILTGIFISALVTCNLIFLKFFTWSPFGLYTFELSVGILPYPVTFLVTDIVSELYGKKRADQVVLTGFVASLFMMGIVLLADAVPQATGSPVSSKTFSEVFGLSKVAVFASMTAYLTAQFIDIRLFHLWKRLTRGKHLWLRNNGSTIFSQLVDTLTVLSLLCLTDALEWSQFPGLLENGVIFKVLVALVDTPLFYLSVALLKPKVHEDPEERNWAVEGGGRQEPSPPKNAASPFRS